MTSPSQLVKNSNSLSRVWKRARVNVPTHMAARVVVAAVLARPDAFFSSITKLQINLPIPLSWADFLNSIKRLTPREIGLIMLIIAMMQLGLLFATTRDDRSAAGSHHYHHHHTLPSLLTPTYCPPLL